MIIKAAVSITLIFPKLFANWFLFLIYKRWGCGVLGVHVHVDELALSSQMILSKITWQWSRSKVIYPQPLCSTYYSTSKARPWSHSLWLHGLAFDVVLVHSSEFIFEFISLMKLKTPSCTNPLDMVWIGFKQPSLLEEISNCIWVCRKNSHYFREIMNHWMYKRISLWWTILSSEENIRIIVCNAYLWLFDTIYRILCYCDKLLVAVSVTESKLNRHDWL